MVIGDINEIKFLSENESGVAKPALQMQRFVDTINRYGLTDLGFVGSKFTWLYQQRNGTQIRERFDRGFAIGDWLDKFPLAKLHHRTSLALDLCPLTLQLKERKKFNKLGQIFHFEAMWLKDSRCECGHKGSFKEAAT